MFTGIIEEVVFLQKISGNRIYITSEVLKDSNIGDSVAINGICLTLTQKQRNIFAFDFMKETYDITTLKYWTPGKALNIERALGVNSRFDGHIVQGHIDGIGRLVEKRDDFLKVQCSSDVLDYVVRKGSIAIDGISLTVIDLGSNFFTVGIIPHTYENTNVRFLNVGDFLNIETDIIARYIKKYINKKEIDIDFLQKNGYI